MIFGRTYSKTIIWQNDVTSAPVNNGGPLAKQFVSTPQPPPKPRTTIISQIGDPNAAPAIVAITAPSVLVRPQQPPPFRGQAILAAAPATIAFSGPTIATPLPRPAVMGTSVVLTPAGPRFGEMPPPPFVITRQPSVSTVPPSLTRQFQDGASVATSGPTPTTLIITRPTPATRSRVMSTATAPAQIVNITAAPLVTRHARKQHAARVFITRTRVAPVNPAERPEPDTPTSITLDAHTATLTLDAHTSTFVLDAHANSVTLDGHANSLVLDAHSNSLTLDS